MGFDSTIVFAQTAGKPSALGELLAYPDIVIEMPRWGWGWAQARHDLTSGSQRYRLMLAEEPEGVTEDVYGAPLRALDPTALLAYIEDEQKESHDLPAVAALCAALKSLSKGDWSGDYVVLCLGH